MSTTYRVTGRLVVAVPVLGVLSGLGGAALTVILHAIQHLVFSDAGATFAQDVRATSPVHRVVGMTLAGGVIGIAWWQLRRRSRPVVPVDRAIAEPARMPFWSSAADAVMQIGAVGAGASLGREGAPRQLAAAVADVVAGRLGFAVAERRLLLAGAAGAGFAAVYNTPVAGLVFTAEILLMTVDYVALSAAAVMSCLAVVTAWPVVGNGPVYHLGAHPVDGWVLAWAVCAGPVCAVAGRGWARLMQRARAEAPRRATAAMAWQIAAAMTVVGVVAMTLPSVTGNGKGVLEALVDHPDASVGLLLALLVAKPLLTAVCLRGGMAGGLITPSMATGGALGALVAVLIVHLGGGASVTVCALVGAAALLGATQRAPAMAGVFLLEVAQAPPTLWLPVAVAVGGVWASLRIGAALR